MSYLKYLLIIFMVVIPDASVVYSQADTSRPKIGLVLSGGGAKGFAHLGVIKVLEEEEIPIDFIAGTSMGAIVGGLIASGIPADSLIRIIRKQNWPYLLSDNILRQNLSITEKRDRDRFIISLPIQKKGIVLPQGIIRGQHIEDLLHELTAPVYDIHDFNKLPIPYLCIALDIDQDKEIVFRNGDLADAMRASMSIPTVFEPIIIHGDRMVDGGIVDNFPVKNIKDMGADIIIGVDVGHQPKHKISQSNFLSVMEDAVFYYSTMIKKENLKHVNIYIHPDLKGLGVSSFTSYDSLFAYGEKAACEKLPAIRRLADSLRSYKSINHVRKFFRHDSIYIQTIQMNGLKNIPKKMIEKSLHFHVLQWVKPSEIRKAVENFYATTYFEKVTFRLEPEGKGARLHFIFREKKGSTLHAGFYYDLDYKTVLTLNTTFLNLFSKGSKLSADLQLGRNPGMDVLYFLDRGHVLSPGFELASHLIETYDYGGNRSRLASYAYFISNARLFLQSRIGDKMLFRAGGEVNHTTLQLRISDIDFGLLNNNFWGVFGSMYLDTRDRSVFSTNGTKLIGEGRYISNSQFHPFGNFMLDFQKTIRLFPRFSMRHELFGGMSTGDSIPYQYNFRIGGQTDFTSIGNIPYPGYKYLETITKNLFYYCLDLQYELFTNVYVGFTAGIGTGPIHISDILYTDYRYSGLGISAGFLSPVGPLKFTLSTSGEMKGTVGYFQFGFAF